MENETYQCGYTGLKRSDYPYRLSYRLAAITDDAETFACLEELRWWTDRKTVEREYLGDNDAI